MKRWTTVVGETPSRWKRQTSPVARTNLSGVSFQGDPPAPAGSAAGLLTAIDRRESAAARRAGTALARRDGLSAPHFVPPLLAVFDGTMETATEPPRPK